MEHIRLLLDIGELNWVFKDSADVESLLQNIVIMVARHMGADVCSIYINDERRNELVLRANVGLSPGTAGKIRLKPGEGIVGTCFADLTPVCTRDSFTHPNFKYFSKTDEDRYKAFLAVPIVSGSLRVGVLVLQRKEEYHFTEDDTLALKVIASQLANMVENVKLLTSMKGLAPAAISPQKPQLKTRFIKGKPAARGYAYGRIVVIDNDRRFSDLETVAFDHSYSIDDFTDAVKTSYVQLETLQKQAERTIADAASLIFTSHLLILKDREFQEKIEMLIRKGKNPPEAVLTVARKYIQVFLASPVEHLQEKSKDIEDIATRILVNMLKQETVLPGLKGRIVIMRETYPSDILRLALEKIKGAIVTSGGTTSHVSILAGSLGLPLIIANEPALLNIDRDAKVLMDAELGNVYVNPEKEVLEGFRDKLQTAKHEMSAAMTPRTLTADGIRVRLMANVNLLKDLELLQKLSCDGIGLYRSEFPFIVRNNFPTEEEQYFVYRKLVEGLPGKQITFRTLDIGGDKELPYAGSLRRDNPFLGLRSIRFSLKHREIFADQIRAILRAGAGADIRIMFPMVFSLEEFAAAKGVVQECLETLSRQSRPYNAAPKTGMMVEVPAVIDIIDDFGAIADFFSIGTNDLIQYLLAVDRTNEEVAEYYLPHHPAVLRAIHRVAAAAARHDVDVSVCGTMANTKAYLPFLIGAGITTLSMNPQYLAESQKIIAAIDAKAAREMAGRLLKLSQIPEIEKILFGAAEPEI